MPIMDMGGKSLPPPANSRGTTSRSYRRLGYLALGLTLFLLWRAYASEPDFDNHSNKTPPSWKKLREYERNLPQHNLSLSYPEGRNGRYVRFSNQIRGLGWNNVLNEILLCAEVAHQSNRAYVFEEYTWKLEYFPWAKDLWPWDKSGKRRPRTPLNALLSGPLVGGPWEAGDEAPRSVSVEYWEKACPRNERTVLMSSTLKNPVRDAEGEKVFKHMVNVIKNAQARCIEIAESPDDNFPQTFDLWLIGDPRGVSMSQLFLNTATSRLFGTSPLVESAVKRNEYLVLPRSKNLDAPLDPYERMMAVHIRRGDFGPACKDRALWASTYYQWNMWPELPDKFVIPPDSGNGTASDVAKEIYRSHCFPTEEELLEKIRQARKEYSSAGENRVLDVMYILTNAKRDWIDSFGKKLKNEGWSTIVSTKDQKLDDEQTEVGMAVDMEIGRKAAVFIGNGWSSFTSNVVHRRLVDKREPVATRFW